MPADYDELYLSFVDLIGTDENFDEWSAIFEETGIDFDDHDQTVEAFEEFLIAFYPQEGMSGDDWWYLRQEFYETYGIDDSNIDWEAWRQLQDS